MTDAAEAPVTPDVDAIRAQLESADPLVAVLSVASLCDEIERLNLEVLKGIERVYRLGEVVRMQRVAHRARRDLMRQHRKSAAVLLGHVKALSAENERLKAALDAREAPPSLADYVRDGTVMP